MIIIKNCRNTFTFALQKKMYISKDKPSVKSCSERHDCVLHAAKFHPPRTLRPYWLRWMLHSYARQLCNNANNNKSLHRRLVKLSANSAAVILTQKNSAQPRGCCDSFPS